MGIKLKKFIIFLLCLAIVITICSLFLLFIKPNNILNIDRKYKTTFITGQEVVEEILIDENNSIQIPSPPEIQLIIINL